VEPAAYPLLAGSPGRDRLAGRTRSNRVSSRILATLRSAEIDHVGQSLWRKVDIHVSRQRVAAMVIRRV